MRNERGDWMKVYELVKQLDLEVLTGEIGLEADIKGGCVGDLLSYVMAHAKEGDIWVTIQGHINTLAVASLVGMSAIVVAEDNEADEAMIEKAKEEGIAILKTPLNSFSFCVKCGQVLKEKW